MVDRDKELHEIEETLKKMILSTDKSLLAYARISGYPVELFYSGANLSGVTLTYDEFRELGLASLDVDLSGARFIKTDEQAETAAQFEAIASELLSSASFATTHGIVSRLSKGAPFSLDAIKIFIRAAVENNQVGWILGDKDLVELMEKLLESPEVLTDRETQAKLASMLELAKM